MTTKVITVTRKKNDEVILIARVIESSEEINWALLKLPKTNSTPGQTYNANFTCPDLPLPASREAAAPFTCTHGLNVRNQIEPDDE